MTDRNGTETTYTYNLYGSLTGRKAQNPEVPGTKLSEAFQRQRTECAKRVRHGYALQLRV